MLTERQVTYILARDNHRCQYDDCPNTATLVQLQYPPDQLHAMHRDPNSPDNYCAICEAHAPQHHDT